jgi:sulfatase modifying factor 1
MRACWMMPWLGAVTACATAASTARVELPEPARPSPPALPAQPPEPKDPEPPADAAPAPSPTCPEEMTLVVRPQGTYCIDRWEASIAVVERDGTRKPWPPNHTVDGLEDRIVAESVPGQKPQGYISGIQAARACERARKRLCEIDEWVRACRGPKFTLYPYGNQRQAKVCNDRFKTIDRHPVVRLFKKYAPPGANPDEMWDPKWMNDPRLFEFDHTVEPSGAFTGCTNAYGAYDMVGNLHEWVADPDGTFFGGFFLDTYQNGEGCEYRTIFHPFDYHDYSTGFRCCRDAE